jgi:hypothetical protein
MEENCLDILPYAVWGFLAAILLSNLAIWRMQKNLKKSKSVEPVPKWKMYLARFADVEPADFLNERGRRWRRVSVAAFVAVILFGLGFAFLRTQSWVCEFAVRQGVSW